MKDIYVKRTYRKLNKRYWNGDHYPWRYIAIVMGLFLIYAFIQKVVNDKPLVSPVAIIPEVTASEIISCETPRGYLECKVYQGEITWEQHDKISRIIQCESNWNPEAINTKNKNGSYDMGLVQINSIHKNIKNSDKLDFKKSIDWMINKIKKDGGYQAWSCARILKLK